MEPSMTFADRYEAGQSLAPRLDHYRGRNDLLVLGLPRGGVPVASEIARYLDAPLDVFLVRKLGVPWQEEVAMGAITSSGMRVVNDDVIAAVQISQADIDAVARKELRRLAQQEKLYRPGGAAFSIQDHCVILVDDGIATGATMRAAATAVRRLRASSVVVAAPVGSRSAREALFADHLVDEVVFLAEPEPFLAVGMWYQDFSQTTDEEVRHLLAEARRLHPV
jgi:putative phosphoribosyl transferase